MNVYSIPLPALPGDGLGDDLEDDPQVGPDHAADEELRRELVLLGRWNANPTRDETIVSVFAIVQTRNARSHSK